MIKIKVSRLKRLIHEAFDYAEHDRIVKTIKAAGLNPLDGELYDQVAAGNDPVAAGNNHITQDDDDDGLSPRGPVRTDTGKYLFIVDCPRGTYVLYADDEDNAIDALQRIFRMPPHSSSFPYKLRTVLMDPDDFAPMDLMGTMDEEYGWDHSSPIKIDPRDLDGLEIDYA